MRRFIAVLCVALGLTFVLPAAAQVNTADLVGKVVDPTGAVVPGAKVTVSNPASGFNRETLTEPTGDYSVAQLQPGTYKVTVEAQGFSTVVYEKVELAIGSKITLDVTLKLGTAREVVTISAETPLVEMTSSEIKSTVSPREVTELPILDRNFTSLTYVVPGVRPAQGFDPTKSRVGQFSLNGSDGRQLSLNVDGADNKDNVVGGLLQNFTVEGIQEFNVVTNRFTAESGRTLAGIVNVVTKSGTNDFHGTLFSLFQVSTLNKIDFFTDQQRLPNQQKLPKPVYHRYHFGGSAGGRVIKDKLFFFGAYEHKREPGKITVEPTAFGELSLFPLAQPVTALPFPYKAHMVTAKVDHRISERQSVSYRYGRERWENPNDQLGNPFVTDLSQTNSNKNQLHDFNINHNFVISTTKTNTFGVHFQDFVNAILADPQRTFTLPVAGGGTATNPEIIFPSSAEIGQNVNVPQQTLERKYQFRDDFTWIHNRHNMKMGVNYIYAAKLGGFFFFGANGYQITFWDDPSCITVQPTLPPATRTRCSAAYLNPNLPASQHGFATPGAVREITFNGGNGNFNQRPHQMALYFQDDFKVTSRLTLNLGVRWDANINFMVKQLGSSLTDTNRTINVLRQVIAANPSAPSAQQGLARARALAGNDEDLRRTTASWKEFQPRVGFAWDPTGSGKHVIRGGYGIAYDQVFQNLTLFSLQQAGPTIYQTVIDLVDSTPPPNPSGNIPNFQFGVTPLPAPAAGLVDIEVGAFGRINDPKMRDPYGQQWSIGWSWQFRPDFAVSVDYYHTLGIHEPRVLNVNPQILTVCGDPTAYPGATPTDPRCVRGASTRFFDAAFQAAGLGAGRLEQINDIGTNTRSRFDSANFVLKKRFSNHYMLQASYVLSRSYSWGGRPTSSYSGNGIAITPENEFKAGEFGPAIFDERHRFVLNGIFELPYGFEVSPVLQVASARPFTFRSGRDIDGDGRTRLDRVCAGSTVTAPIIPGANGPFLCEQVPVNSLRGDPLKQLDVTFAKGFKFYGERLSLRLYWQLYNLFNTDNFGNNFGENARSSTFNKPLGYFAGQGFSPAFSGPLRSQFGFRFEW